MNIVKTKTVKATWCGRPGVSIDHHLDSRSVGLRIHVFSFDDENLTTIRLIKGDGRKFNDFVVHHRQVIAVKPDAIEVAEAVKAIAESAGGVK